MEVKESERLGAGRRDSERAGKEGGERKVRCGRERGVSKGGTE